MINYIAEGGRKNYLTTGAVVAGSVIVMGEEVGIATTGAAGAGVTISVALKGVYSLPKHAEAFTDGAKVYYNSAVPEVTVESNNGASPPVAFVLIGHAFGAALSGDATAKVKLLNL